MLSYSQQLFLSNPRTLREWSHLSLMQRAALVRERYDLPSFTYQTLANYYKRLGIRYHKPQFAYTHKDVNEGRILKEQQDVCRQILRYQMEERMELLYIDETTFNVWQAPNRCWVKEGMTITLSD